MPVAHTVASLLDEASARILSALDMEKREARLEARVLAAFALQVSPAWLIAHDTDPLTQTQITHFGALLTRRLSGEPIAYLTGMREFYGRIFRVSPDVLIPRPDTELLVELALSRMPPGQAIDVLDLGTGSGCIAISLALERPLACVTAVDRSESALAVARQNANSLGAKVEFLVSDWFDSLASRRFDLVVGNPPYIAAADPHLTLGDVRFEPLSALAAGEDGLADLRLLTVGAAAHLKPGGTLLLEHGYDQAEAVQALLKAAGFRAIQSWPDLSGIRRVSGGELSE